MIKCNTKCELPKVLLCSHCLKYRNYINYLLFENDEIINKINDIFITYFNNEDNNERYKKIIKNIIGGANSSVIGNLFMTTHEIADYMISLFYNLCIKYIKIINNQVEFNNDSR